MNDSRSFEDAVEDLEAIVKRLESDATSLEDALRLFEEGVGLSRLCASRIEEAEQKVLLLLEDKTGSLSTQPMSGSMLASALQAPTTTPSAPGPSDAEDF